MKIEIIILIIINNNNNNNRYFLGQKYLKDLNRESKYGTKGDLVIIIVIIISILL